MPKAQLPLSLVIGSAQAFETPAGQPLPRRIKIASWGENVARGHGKDGEDTTFQVGARTAQIFAALKGQFGSDLVALDFEHSSERKAATYQPGPLHVAGHGTVEAVEGEGLFFIVAGYTPTGREYAADYADVSGVFQLDRHGEVMGVSSVALTQRGAVPGALFQEAERTLAASMGGTLQGTEEEQLHALVSRLLGYGDDAELSDLLSGLSALLTQRDRLAAAKAAENHTNPPRDENNPTPPTDEMDTKTAETLTAAIKENTEVSKAVLASMKERSDQAALDTHNAAVEREIQAGIDAGKAVPASLKLKDDAGRYVQRAENVKEILAAIPATVKTEPGKEPEKKADATTEADRTVMASLGIQEDDWKKGSRLPIANEPASAGLVS